MGNSLIFTAASSQYLTAIGKTSASTQKLTIATWMKTSGGPGGAQQPIYEIDDGTSNNVFILTLGLGKIFVSIVVSGSAIANVESSASFIDGNWHSIVVAIDTTQVTAANRIKFYADGTLISSFSQASYPTQNANLPTNLAHAANIGFGGNEVSTYFNGNLAQTYYIDGQQLTPSSFISGTPGVPIAYTGTYSGTFDFFLPYSNNTSTVTLGADSSGEGNNWTLNNMTTANQSSDYPTSNIENSNALLQGAGSFLSAAIAQRPTGLSSFTGIGNLTANALNLVYGGANFIGNGGLLANAGPLFPGFHGIGLLFAGASAFTSSGAVLNGAGSLNANAILAVFNAADFAGSGLLTANAGIFIPSLTPGQTVYIPPEATFVDSNTAPVFVGESVAIVFGNINAPIPPDESLLQLVVTKPDGSQRSIGFPLCYVGLVDIPFKTTSNFLYYPSLTAGTYCVGQLYANEIDQSGNWSFQLFNGSNRLSQAVTIFVNPR